MKWHATALVYFIAAFATAQATDTRQAPQTDAPTLREQVADLARQCSAREVASPAQAPTLYERLGGEARIHAMTREMVRLHRQHPQLSAVVSKYDPDYLADILARYLITNTGGPHRYDGPSLAETHAHLHLTDE